MILSDCKKKSAVSNKTLWHTPVQSPIYKTVWLNKNTGFFCGGVNNEEGYIFKTNDAGQNWKKVHTQPTNCLYDVYFTNDSVGYACGEDMLILRTNNGGQSWFSIENKQNSSQSYYGTLRGIYGNEKLLLFTGGTNFNIGIINWVRNGIIQSSWSGYKGIDNEMRCGLLLGSNNYLSFGYGAVYITYDGKKFERMNRKGDFYTASCSVNNSVGFVCSYNGAVYKVSDEGTKMEQLTMSNRFYKKHINFNSIAFVNENLGWVVGNKGEAYQTTNGKKFTALDLQTKEDLTSVVLNKNNEVVISTNRGKLIRLAY